MNRSLKGPAVALACLAGVAMLAVALWLGSPAPQITSTVQPVPQAAPEPVLAEQIVQLPEDGGEYHLSVFVGTGWRARAQERQIVAWFDTQPRLVSLRSQCHWHLVVASDPIYPRYASTITSTPAVVLQNEKGKVLYKASGANMPPSPEGMAEEIGRIFPNRPHLFPLRPCPGPNCPPKPEPPKPNVDVDVNVQPPVPDVRPDATDNAKQVFVPLLVAGAIASFLAGIAIAWKNQYHG